MNKNKIESYFFLGILSIIWGSSFILMKKGMLAYSAPQVASLRIFIAGLVFIPFVIKHFREIPWNNYKYVLIFAFLEIGFPPYLYTFAQQHIDSSSAGILNSMVPIFTLATGVVIFRLRYNLLTTLGVFVGLLGALIITYMKSIGASGSQFDMSNSWGLLILIATFFYAIAGNVLKEHLNEVPGAMVTGLSFVSMAIPAGIYLFADGFVGVTFSGGEHVIQSLLSVTILSVFGSALAILMFSKLIQVSNALFASFVTYLIPFVSLLWGWLDNENISLVHFSSLAIIFLGIFLASSGEKRNKTNVNLVH